MHFCEEPACVDMRPGSELITLLQASDDTVVPGQGITMRVYWTPNDGIINPVEGSHEPYATIVQVDEELDHLTMLADPALLADAAAFLTR